LCDFTISVRFVLEAALATGSGEGNVGGDELKIRPRWPAISRSIIARQALSWAIVPASSSSINRL
jgi:hypothetical protein